MMHDVCGDVAQRLDQFSIPAVQSLRVFSPTDGNYTPTVLGTCSTCQPVRLFI